MLEVLGLKRGGRGGVGEAKGTEISDGWGRGSQRSGVVWVRLRDQNFFKRRVKANAYV